MLENITCNKRSYCLLKFVGFYVSVNPIMAENILLSLLSLS